MDKNDKYAETRIVGDRFVKSMAEGLKVKDYQEFLFDNFFEKEN